MNPDHVGEHLRVAFGLQAFYRAKERIRREQGLTTLVTPAEWQQAFSKALYESIPESSSHLYAIAKEQGLGTLMISSQDETGAGRVFHALYGRYFETHGGYESYVESVVGGQDTDVVVSVSRQRGISLVGFSPLRSHPRYVLHGTGNPRPGEHDEQVVPRDDQPPEQVRAGVGALDPRD